MATGLQAHKWALLQSQQDSSDEEDEQDNQALHLLSRFGVRSFGQNAQRPSGLPGPADADSELYEFEIRPQSPRSATIKYIDIDSTVDIPVTGQKRKRSTSTISVEAPRKVQRSAVTAIAAPSERVLAPSGSQELPSDVRAFAAAVRHCTDNGILDITRLHQTLKAQGSPSCDYFRTHTHFLKQSAPVWQYSLEQLGLSQRIWLQLNKKSGHQRLPGQSAELIATQSHTANGHESNGNKRQSVESIPAPSAGASAKANDSKSTTPAAWDAVPGPDTDDETNVPLAARQQVTDDEDDDVPLLYRRAASTPAGQSPSLLHPSASIPQASSGQHGAILDLDSLEELLLSRMKAAVDAGRAGLSLPWQPEEDDAVTFFKEIRELTWDQFEKRKLFIHRSTGWYIPQSRYSIKLSRRDRSQDIPELLPYTLKPSTERLATLQNSATAIFRSGSPLSTISRAGKSPQSHDAPDEVENHPASHAVAQDNGTRILTRVSRNPLITRYLTDRDGAIITSGLRKLRTSGSAPYKRSARPLITQVPKKRLSLEIHRHYFSDYEKRFFLQSLKQGDVWDEQELAKWRDVPIHVDFTSHEIQALWNVLLELTSKDVLWTNSCRHDKPSLSNLVKLLLPDQNADETIFHRRVEKIANELVFERCLARSVKSIENFLYDLVQQANTRGDSQSYSASSCPSLHRLGSRADVETIGKALRDQEVFGTRGSRNAVFDTLGMVATFTGTSNDVNAIAWSQDGTTFAAGSTAFTDEDSMQYNRRLNLLVGDTHTLKLRELPHHATARVLAATGVNSTLDMKNSQDPLLYPTVSAVAFSGDYMLSAGYDCYARIYDVTRGLDVKLQATLLHPSKIEVLTTNDAGLFATGCRSLSKEASVRVWNARDSAKIAQSTSLLAKSARNYNPEALKFGPSKWGQSRYLLCGFSEPDLDFGEGEVCIWDVEQQNLIVHAKSTRAVFDVAWSDMTFGRFAVASAPSSRVNLGMRSTVQVFDSRRVNGNMSINSSRTCELECSALDINDVLFNPSDDNLVVVGATNGSSYIWDLRNPNHVLQQFQHGRASLELDDTRPREIADTGVRFISFDGTRRFLYSGSSDGIVAKWDPYRAPEDAFVKTVVELQSGVMSGAFSPDFSSLLLGEVKGSVNLMSVGRSDEEIESFTLQHASDEELAEVMQHAEVEMPPVETNVDAAAELFNNGVIDFKPFGNLPLRQAVQGPNYDSSGRGWYDRSPDAYTLRDKAQQWQRGWRPSRDTCACIKQKSKLLTEEDMVDDGSWKGRIPANIRLLPDCEAVKAWISLTFARCSGNLKADIVAHGFAILICNYCSQVWRPNLLGFSPVNLSNGQTKTDIRMDGLERKFGVLDEEEQLQSIEDYLHSMWLDEKIHDTD